MKRSSAAVIIAAFGALLMNGGCAASTAANACRVDADCGGAAADGCQAYACVDSACQLQPANEAAACTVSGTLRAGVCAAGACVDACANGVKDPGESDVDCGGSTCAPCTFAHSCTVSADCAAGLACDPTSHQCTCDVDCGACGVCTAPGACTSAAAHTACTTPGGAAGECSGAGSSPADCAPACPTPSGASGGHCSSLDASSASMESVTFGDGSPSTPAGGAIVPGVYELVGLRSFVTASSHMSSHVRALAQISACGASAGTYSMELAVGVDGMVRTYQFALTATSNAANATVLSAQLTCGDALPSGWPAAGAATWEYGLDTGSGRQINLVMGAGINGGAERWTFRWKSLAHD
jgi:hypothetical protein